MSKIGTKENSKKERNCRTNHPNFYFSFHRKRTFLSSWRKKKRKERCSFSLERKAFFLKEGGARWLAIKQRRKLSAIVPTLPSTPSRTNEGEIRAKLSQKIVSRPPFTNSLTAGDPPEGGREGNNASPNRNQIASPFITNRLPFVLPPPPSPPPPPSSWTSFAPLFFAHHGIIEQDWWEPRDWRLGEREETLHPLHPSPPPDISRFVEWFVIHTRTNMCIIYLEYMFHTIFPSSEVSIRFRTRRYRSTLDGLAWKHTFRGTYIYIYIFFSSSDPRVEGERNWTSSFLMGGRSFMDYDYILKKKRKRKRKTGGRKRGEIEEAGALSGRGPLARNNKQWEKWMGC